MPLDPHLPPPHRVTLDFPVVSRHLRLTREPKVPLQMLLMLRARTQQLQPRRHLNHALLALPILPARRRHLHPQPLRIVEDRPAALLSLRRAAVDGERDRHSVGAGLRPARCASALRNLRAGLRPAPTTSNSPAVPP